MLGAQRHNPRAARSLPRGCAAGRGVVHDQVLLFLSAFSPGREDRQHRLLRVVSVSPCFGKPSPAQPSPPHLTTTARPVPRPCSVCSQGQTCFLLCRSRSPSKPRYPPASPPNTRTGQLALTARPRDGCPSTELVASHGRPAATGKALPGSKLAVLPSAVPGNRLTRPRPLFLGSVCPPWRHREFLSKALLILLGA